MPDRLGEFREITESNERISKAPEQSQLLLVLIIVIL